MERYLIEIARNYNVPYEPDAMVRVSGSVPLVRSRGAEPSAVSVFVMIVCPLCGQPEVCEGEEADLIDVNIDKKPGGGGGGGGGFSAPPVMQMPMAGPMPMNMPMPMPSAFNYPQANGTVPTVQDFFYF